LDHYYSLGTTITFYFNEDQRRTTSTGFFAETISNIRRSIEDSDAPQWVIYSAHDVTLGMILAGLDLWSAECIFENYKLNISDSPSCITTYPSFATVMVFEVYEYSNKTFTFKINYNDIYLEIPFCNYQQECSVETLEKWF
jgi:hypothetical protein